MAELLDGLASPGDRLWPVDRWPAMKFDRPLAVGATGGHGPIRYYVEDYAPGSGIRFRFTAPPGFNGYHGFEVEPLTHESTRLRHVLRMEANGRAAAAWSLVFRPLHDALIEDALDRAAEAFGVPHTTRKWSLRVRLLRRIVRRGRGLR